MSERRRRGLSRVVDALVPISGVRGVAVTGSVARGTAHEDSDLDVALFYREAQRPPLTDLRAAVQQLDDSSEAIPSDYGGWGPLLDGGAWLTVDGLRVDIVYRNVDVLARRIRRSARGRISLNYWFGFPYGIPSYSCLTVAYDLPVHDPFEDIQSLQCMLTHYPPRLKAAIVERSIEEARFTILKAAKPARRGDRLYVIGSAYRVIACLVQVIYALNERYYASEKDVLDEIRTMRIMPADFVTRTLQLSASAATKPRLLVAKLDDLGQLLHEVEELCSSGLVPASPFPSNL